MFDERSRYARLPTREHVTPDDRRISYVTRRFVTPPEAYVAAGGIRVTDSDRIDIIAHRAHGVPTGFWQIADANEAMQPEELTQTPGRRVVIPVPRAAGVKG